MKDISFTKDIIEKTAKELNITKEAVNYLYTFCIQYMHTQLHSTDACSFHITNLGYLYIDAEYVDKVIEETSAEIEKNGITVELRKRKLNFQHKKKALEIYSQRVKRTYKPKDWSYHYQKDSFDCPELTGGRTKEEMQYFQNRFYEDLANNKE